ncbi:MAG: RNase adapter RapZ [Oscillospiraceae bacterium]|nr:RNase adapter RapZ [Oscillospiraceae bacterium]
MELIIISGLSGAGKSRVAAVLEDMDFYCVDNMPLSMLPKFAELCLATGGRYERVAIVTDTRAMKNISELFVTLDEIREMGCQYTILFIEAEVDTIIKRFKETRRRHPMGMAGRALEDTIKNEAEMLKPLRDIADGIIDTTSLTLSKLQNRLALRFREGQQVKSPNINVKSFGYKYGVPVDSDLVFDVRFMPNPYYVTQLKGMTGLDDPVKDFIFAHEQSREFFSRLCDMLAFLLPYYIEEGKQYLVVCIGCTGGKHRSVTMAEALAAHLAQQGYSSDCTHRDIERDN